MKQSPSHALDFGSVVHINREIRAIVEVSRQVNLSAINAMFIAKKSGEAARGFGVVSGELQVFARQLGVVMEQLGELVFRLLESVAWGARHRKMGRYHALASERDEFARLRLEMMVSTKRQAAAGTDAQIRDRSRQILSRIQHAQRLCQTGVSLSRAAKIEAVYGAGHAGALKQVSEQVEATIQEIAGTLKGLRVALGGAQA